MNTIKLHEQISFLRKQKGLTQEQLANTLGVTNQSVSKWESGQCCPDIQLLPSIAALFDVSVDELLGCSSAKGLGDICLSLKDYFSALPEKESFENAYRLAALLHEIAVTDGYKKFIPWQQKDYSTDIISSWGLSVCSEPEGSTGRMADSVFFSLGKAFQMPNSSQLYELSIAMERFSDLNVLKTMYAIHELTIGDFELYVALEDISSNANLPADETRHALEKLPITIKEENGELLYRLEDSFCHMPALLTFLFKFR
ncbi:MAG: helix-turn-helix transcriptional regulator [Lachnospiraceae bacterium]|nr:helix-turn-helix transcriptional regulator [Lachnospiraceae bacterium]